MARRFLRLVTALVGAAIGCGLLSVLDSIVLEFSAKGISLFGWFEEWAIPWLYVSAGLLSAIIFFILSPKILEALGVFLKRAEATLASMPVMDIFFAALGLILGLLVALLITSMLRMIPMSTLVTTPLSIGVYLLCGYLGISVVVRRRAGYAGASGQAGEAAAYGWLRGSLGEPENHAKPKILDTSVIIDGRIFDICQTGVMEGTLVVPGFVLQELRHIADSADALKRGRGRRGLDILARMQKELPMTVRVEEKDYEDVAEVDAKLLKLAQDLRGVVVTNDYNLNKVASVQDVPVFNINELANAIKPVVLPGEEMRIQIVKEGKESGQGVGYMDDGTMIVVEGGKRCIGDEVSVQVTSVLQTAAGRMIFAKTKG